MLDFGTKFDHMDPEAALRYYEDQVETENETAKLNRRYLYWLMRIGNFKGWPFEWWHFDHADDPVGAFISNKETAKFGYIENKPTADITLTEPKFYE
jgi:D-alanyl-D-alanine dipeptidase